MVIFEFQQVAQFSLIQKTFFTYLTHLTVAPIMKKWNPKKLPTLLSIQYLFGIVCSKIAPRHAAYCIWAWLGGLSAVWTIILRPFLKVGGPAWTYLDRVQGWRACLDIHGPG